MISSRQLGERISQERRRRNLTQADVACVAVNRRHPPERRLWSLLHETGHFFRDREAGDVSPTSGPDRTDGDEEIAVGVEAFEDADGHKRVILCTVLPPKEKS